MEGQVAEVEVHEAVPTDVADSVFDDPQAAVQLEEDTGSLEPIAGESVIVSKVEDSEEARQCLDRIRERNEAVAEFEENHFWTLSEDLYQVRSKKLFELLNYKKFPEYLDKELGMAKRRGYYLANTFEYLSVTLKAILADKPDLYARTVDSIKKMGWTKAMHIATAKSITSDNAEEIIPQIVGEKDAGGYLSVKEIEALCKEEKSKLEASELEEADGGDETLGKTTKTVSFTFTQAQYNDVIKAIDQMKAIAGDSGAKKQTLLTSICRDYLSTYSASQGGEVDVQAVMSNYERLTGKSIVVFDPKTSEVVYGQDSVSNLSQEPE